MSVRVGSWIGLLVNRTDDPRNHHKPRPKVNPICFDTVSEIGDLPDNRRVNANETIRSFPISVVTNATVLIFNFP